MTQINLSKLFNFIVDHNKKIEITPFVSTVYGTVNLFVKFFVVPCLSNETILDSKVFTHIKSKSYKEIFGSIIFLIGNIYIYCKYEKLNQEAIDNQKKMIENNPALINKANDHILDSILQEKKEWINLLEMDKAIKHLNNNPALITHINDKGKLLDALDKNPELIKAMIDFDLLKDKSLRDALYEKFKQNVDLAARVCWNSFNHFRKLIQSHPKFFRFAIISVKSVQDYFPHSEKIQNNIPSNKPKSINKFIERCLNRRPNSLFKIFSQEELSNQGFVKAIAVSFPEVMLHVPEELRKNQEFIKKIIYATKDTDEKSKYRILLYVAESVRNSKEFVEDLCYKDESTAVYIAYAFSYKVSLSPCLFAGENCVKLISQLISEYEESPNKKYRHVGFEFVRKAVRKDNGFLKKYPKILCTFDGGQSLAHLKWVMKKIDSKITAAPQHIRLVHALQFLDLQDAREWSQHEIFKKDLKK